MHRKILAEDCSRHLPFVGKVNKLELIELVADFERRGRVIDVIRHCLLLGSDIVIFDQ